MKRIASLAGAVLFGTGMAMAECPAHVSSLAGVKLAKTTPYVASIFRQTPEGLSEIAAPDTDAAAEGVVAIYPHPLVQGSQVAPYSELAFEYEADTADLEDLKATGVWRSPAEFLLNGRKIQYVVFELRLVGTEMFTIGDCTTEVWLVESRMDMGDGDGSRKLRSYAPALGLVLRSVTLSADGEPLEEFAYDRIEAVDE